MGFDRTRNRRENQETPRFLAAHEFTGIIRPTGSLANSVHIGITEYDVPLHSSPESPRKVERDKYIRTRRSQCISPCRQKEFLALLYSQGVSRQSGRHADRRYRKLCPLQRHRYVSEQKPCQPGFLLSERHSQGVWPLSDRLCRRVHNWYGNSHIRRSSRVVEPLFPDHRRGEHCAGRLKHRVGSLCSGRKSGSAPKLQAEEAACRAVCAPYTEWLRHHALLQRTLFQLGRQEEKPKRQASHAARLYRLCYLGLFLLLGESAAHPFGILKNSSSRKGSGRHRLSHILRRYSSLYRQRRIGRSERMRRP